MKDRGTWWAMVGLSVVGLGIAAYLTYVHYEGIESLCLAGGSCKKVQSSEYADLLGIPVALLGLIGYALILGSLFVPGELGRLAGLVLVFGGWAFSAYLTYREVFTIEAICHWCVASAVVMTALVVLASWRYVRADDD